MRPSGIDGSAAGPATPAQRWALAAMVLMLALALLGLRGLWDPDEGRYTNVALMMLDSGDWLNPRRNHEVGHWTKPPLTYWAIAVSVAVFGPSPWAARLPGALAYLLCTWLTWRIGRRLVPQAPHIAALAWATMLLPFGASQLITTDMLLTACETLAVWAFVESRFGSGRHPWRWSVVMWSGFALAFLTKGPPGLLPLLPLTAFAWLVPRVHGRRLFDLAGLVVFALLALPWYVAVVIGNPGLFAYFVGDEVINRVTTDEFGRHAEWYAWIEIYLPTLLLGTLPWTPALWRWARSVPALLRGWRHGAARRAQAERLLPVLWLLLPLLVFCLARSRMPLYVLPLFVPMALLVAQQWAGEGRGLPRWPWLLGWCALLLGLQVAASHWPTHKNAANWADAIRQRHPQPLREVVFVDDMARYGLHLHLGVKVEKVSLAPLPPANGYAAPAYDSDLAFELAEHEPDVVWITKQARWSQVRRQLQAAGYRGQALGAPYRGRIIFTALPLAGPDRADSG